MEGNGGSRDEGSCDGGGSRDWESNVTEDNGGSRDWVMGGHVICGSHVIGGGHVMKVDVMEVNGGHVMESGDWGWGVHVNWGSHVISGGMM